MDFGVSLYSQQHLYRNELSRTGTSMRQMATPTGCLGQEGRWERKAGLPTLHLRGVPPASPVLSVELWSLQAVPPGAM